MISNAEKLRDAVALHAAATTNVNRLAVVRDIKRGPAERKGGAS